MLAQYLWILPARLPDRRGYLHATERSGPGIAARRGGALLTKFVATIVSSDSGLRTILQVIASTNILSTVTSGNSLATAAATSSQSTIPFRWALLFVTTVRSFRGLLCAVSNANLMMRSTPWRVNMATSVAVSQGWPRWLRPPCPAYSPSEFSRTMTQSRSPVLQFLRGDWVPRKTLVGLTLAYCWKGWQIANRRPQSEMWSGTSPDLLAKTHMPPPDKGSGSRYAALTWGADGAKQNSVVLLKLLESAIGNVFPGLLVGVRAPVEVSEVDVERP